MNYSKTRKEDIQRVFVGVDRCLNPECQKPLKYAKYPYKGYCCRECMQTYTPTMVYFSRVYSRPFRDVLVMLLNRYRNQVETAQHLGVQAKTVYKWVGHYNIKKINKKWA